MKNRVANLYMSFLRVHGVLSFLIRTGVIAILFVCSGIPNVAMSATTTVCDKAELNSAISSARPGDVIKMCNGTWNNSKIVFQVNGTSSSPITLKAETPGKVFLTGSSQLYIAGKFAVVDGLVFKGRYTGSDFGIIQFQNENSGSCSDCRLTNVSVLEYNPSDSAKNTKWVIMHGVRNRVDHSHFRGKTNLGAMVQIKRDGSGVPNYHRIDHNFFEKRPDMRSATNVNGDTLEIGSQGKYAYTESRSIIEYNYMLDIDSDYEVITVKSSGNTVRYNVLDSSVGTLSLRQGTNNRIDGNYIVGRGKSGTGGVRVNGKGHTIVNNYIVGINPGKTDSKSPIILASGTDVLQATDAGQPFYHYAVAENITVAHNTVVDSGMGIVIGQGNRARAPRNVKINANVFLRTGGLCVEDVKSGPNIEFFDNVCHAATNSSNNPGFYNFNPELRADGRGIFRPGAGSRVVNGTSTKAIAGLKDMDGQARVGAYDLGADEFVSGSNGRGPIEICETGPRTYGNGGACAGSNRPAPKPPTNLSIL